METQSKFPVETKQIVHVVSVPAKDLWSSSSTGVTNPDLKVHVPIPIESQKHIKIVRTTIVGITADCGEPLGVHIEGHVNPIQMSTGMKEGLQLCAVYTPFQRFKPVAAKAAMNAIDLSSLIDHDTLQYFTQGGITLPDNHPDHENYRGISPAYQAFLDKNFRALITNASPELQQQIIDIQPAKRDTDGTWLIHKLLADEFRRQTDSLLEKAHLDKHEIVITLYPLYSPTLTWDGLFRGYHGEVSAQAIMVKNMDKLRVMLQLEVQYAHIQHQQPISFASPFNYGVQSANISGKPVAAPEDHGNSDSESDDD